MSTYQLSRWSLYLTQMCVINHDEKRHGEERTYSGEVKEYPVLKFETGDQVGQLF